MKRPYLIYLASQSPRRAEILKSMGIPFKTVSSRYREKDEKRLSPEELVTRHALGKASRAVLPAERAAGGIREFILGSDTTVYFEGNNLGKPKSYEEAADMLEKMRGRVHYVYTGIAVLERDAPQSIVRFDRTKVKFRRWNRDRIESYVRRVHSLDKAGGYAIQSSPSIVLSREGSLSNVIGLPKELLCRVLREFGADL